MRTGSAPEPGIDGAVLRNKDSAPRTVNSIGVSSVDDYASKVESHGGKLVIPKMSIPNVGYLAYCQDTEGNIIGLFQLTARPIDQAAACGPVSLITRSSASGPSAPTT